MLRRREAIASFEMESMGSFRIRWCACVNHGGEAGHCRRAGHDYVSPRSGLLGMGICMQRGRDASVLHLGFVAAPPQILHGHQGVPYVCSRDG